MPGIYWNLIIPLAIIVVFDITLFILIKVKVIQRLRLTRNLIVVLLVVTLVPILCIVFTNERKTSAIIYINVCNNLTATGKTRTLFLNERLEDVKSDAESFAKHGIILEFLQQVSLEKANKADSNFISMKKNVQEHLNRMLSTGEYEDIMLVSAEGRIELTGTNHRHTEETGIDISSENYFKQGKEKTYFTDLFYNKFSDANLMYIITPCLDRGGKFVGCVMVEMNMKKINEVLVNREGLGESGETYLVNREKFIVSESRFQKDAVLKVRVDTRGVNEGLTGQSGLAIYPDYRNIPVIGAWNPVKYTHWVLLAEIDEKEAFASLRANRINQIIFVSVAGVLVIIIAIFSARATIKPVHALIDISRHIKDGELNQKVKIKSFDEIGILIDVFNVMIENMCFLIKQCQDSIMRISAVSAEILSTTEEQSSGTTELAASTTEITATIDELSSSAKQIAVNAESVATVAKNLEVTGLQGTESVSASVRIMGDVKEMTKDSASGILSLSEKSQKIGSVLDIIKGVAEETHLLALNASIEASSAGEFGKRFGVVASEVRRLAERTKASAEEIKGIISEIYTATNAAVLTTEQNVKNVEKGAEITQKAGQSIEAILNLITQTADASNQIVMATQQQKTATEQVALTMREISEVVKQTASGLKQSTAAVAELNKLADELKETVKKFKT